MLSRLHRWRHNGWRRLDPRRTEHTWNPPIRLRIINPITEEVEVQGFKSAGGLHQHVKAFKGVLWGPLNDFNPTSLGPNDYSDIQPDSTYRIVSPFFQAVHEQRTHCQTSDKAYEQKCRHAMTEYLRAADPIFTELPRKIYSDHKVLAEWEGVYEKGDGSVVFLEVKHRMTLVCSCQLKEANPRIGSHCRSKG